MGALLPARTHDGIVIGAPRTDFAGPGATALCAVLGAAGSSKSGWACDRWGDHPLGAGPICLSNSDLQPQILARLKAAA